MQVSCEEQEYNKMNWALPHFYFNL